MLGRSGGEEFLLLLPDTELAQALALAERLRQSVAEARVPHGGQALAITLSIGVALMGADDRSADDVLARADRALYAAKAAGRNAVRAQAD
jgi:diguanylate cyclase (GGDEF)-like protein